MPKSNCTIGLLVHASQAAYRLKKDNLIDPLYSESYAQILIDMAEAGYSITESIAPIASQGTGKTSLAAVCLSPQDSQNPLVISFRGTKTGSDIISDVRLGTLGVVEKEFRDAAFEFYLKVRAQYPNRQIVLTGHSLGGHLAQYVATKAYHTDSSLINNSLIQVRTFNTAPIDTDHSVVFNTNPDLLSNFVNYRLSPDVVSDLPLQQYYGNTFVFPCDKNALAAHPMEAIVQSLPGEILTQHVGADSKSEKKQDLLIELLRGVVYSYQCRVEGQFFSHYRAGIRNLAEFQKALPLLIEAIGKGDYTSAQEKLLALNDVLDGTVSKNIVNVLTKKVEELAKTQGLEHSDVSQKTQADFKHAVKDFRTQLETSKEQAVSEHSNLPTFDS